MTVAPDFMGPVENKCGHSLLNLILLLYILQ